MRERIYLDSCVLNRATDDQKQERIQLEATTIAHILDAAAAGRIEWIASEAVRLELIRNPNARRRRDSLNLLAFASQLIHPTPLTLVRAGKLTSQGFGAFDALHLALAEQAGVETLLTVDDRFLRRAVSRPPGTPPSVENPIDWMRRRQPWLIKR